MIKFFRKIRQSSIKENKITRYFLYAFGEIILVVIGILIALQINTWNQKRITTQEEQIILNNLNAEFKQNKRMVEQIIAANDACYKTGQYIMSLIGTDRKTLESINTDSLLFMNFEYSRFTPSDNALTDLLQSGRLKLIKNDTLKLLLHDWTKVNKGVEDQFKGVDDKVQLELVPYLTQKYPMKNIDSYSRLKWKRNSTIEIDKLAIFNDIVYENILDDYLYRLTGYTIELKKTERIIEALVHLTQNK